MKLTGRQQGLLREALRRFLRWGHEYGGDLLQAWTGLGHRTGYKPVLDAGLMEWVREPAPRCMGWLRLTPAGAEIVQGWIDQEETATNTETWQDHYELHSRRI